MDKLVAELIELLRELLGAYERQLGVARARQDAMRAYDLERLNALSAREAAEAQALEALEKRRKALMARFRRELGVQAFGGGEPTTSQIARRCPEPLKGQILSLAGKLREVLVQVDRANRVNEKISATVIQALGKVLKIITGVSQHAGLYMRNGKKAALAGIHLLELTA